VLSTTQRRRLSRLRLLKFIWVPRVLPGNASELTAKGPPARLLRYGFPRIPALGRWVNEKVPACQKLFVTKSLPSRYLLVTGVLHNGSQLPGARLPLSLSPPISQ
jgi:hypothetical protein